MLRPSASEEDKKLHFSVDERVGDVIEKSSRSRISDHMRVRSHTRERTRENSPACIHS